MKRIFGFKGHVTAYRTYCAYYRNKPEGTLELMDSENYEGRPVFIVAEALFARNDDKPNFGRSRPTA